MAGVKLYCPNCEDIYNPRIGRHESIDGAFFGTTFPHLFFQTFPELFPSNHNENRVNVEKYIPRIFGFKIHGFPGSSSCNRDGSSSNGNSNNSNNNNMNNVISSSSNNSFNNKIEGEEDVADVVQMSNQ